MPVKQGETVVGTFGTYFRTYREPSSEEIKGIELLASAVAKTVSDKVLS